MIENNERYNRQLTKTSLACICQMVRDTLYEISFILAVGGATVLSWE